MADSTDAGQQHDPITGLQAYLAALQAPLVATTRHAAALPGPSDLAFHRSVDKAVASGVDEQLHNVRRMVQQVAQWAGVNLESADDDADDDEASHPTPLPYKRIAEAVDALLERSDTSLDYYTGRLQQQPASTSQQLTAPMPVTTKNGKLPTSMTNAQIPLPQLKFTLKPDNDSSLQWDRKLAMGKPNALVGDDLSTSSSSPPPSLQSSVIRQGMYCAEGDPRHNPYYHEIHAAAPPVYVYQPPSEQELNPPPPLDEAVPQGVAGVPFHWIDTRQGVQELARHLDEDRVKEIAIDLEHHAYRSYQGIACLMQLSTCWADYVIDLLSDDVRQSIEVLNTSFTHPQKVKILHGAEHDVLWLQRDCGLYLVNLFDTYHATNVLPFPAHGLAYLLQKYYDFEADKRYQLADWRIRPLPREMLYYARSDTHALIYVYHRLRSELLNAGGKVAMDEVFKRSKTTAARRYAKEVWDAEGNTREGWRSMWRRMGGDEARGTDARLEPAQMNRTERLLRRMHQWRDEVARQEDESPRYILSAQNLINLASRAPMTKSEALAIFSPGIPPVRKRAGEVARIIKEEVLAWEQDQKQRQDAQRAELLAAAGADTQGEDVGSSAVPPVAVAPQTQTVTPQTVPSQPATPVPTSVSPIVTSLWAISAAGSSSSARPTLRSQRSLLFGNNAGVSSGAAHAANGLQQSLMQSLHTVVGNGRAAEASAEDTPLEESIQPKAPTQPSASTSSSAPSSPSASPTLPERTAEDDTDADADASHDIVKVKKTAGSKKPRWSREQKRKARSGVDDDHVEGDAQAPASSPPPTKKTKAVKPSSSAAQQEDLTPFDYASQPSILDNPMSVATAKKGANKQQSGAKKTKKATSLPNANDPARFATRPAPRDRTEIKGASRSRTFR